jgi:hypothetical protein
MEVKNEQRIIPPDLRSFQLLSIVNEEGQTIHRYENSYEESPALVPSGRLPTAVQQIFNSFEMLATSPFS